MIREFLLLLSLAWIVSTASPAAGGPGAAPMDSARAARDLGIPAGARMMSRPPAPQARLRSGLELESSPRPRARIEALGDADGAWIQAPPPGYFGGVAAYDSTHDRMLLCVGGWPGDRDRGWQLGFSTPGNWTPLGKGAGANPPDVYNALGVMDTRRDRLIVFGGDGGSFRSPLGYTAELDPEPVWNPIYTSTRGVFPPGRSETTGAYDSKRDRVIVFGGFGERDVLGDAWALTLSDTIDWHRLLPAGDAPSPRMDASAVYDPGHDQMLLFGGLVLVGDHILDATDELWALQFGDTVAWIRLAPTGDLPGPRASHRALWDAASSTMLVFGGGSSSGSANDVYQYDPATNAWTRLTATGGPRREYYNAQVAFDRKRDRYVFYGGGSNAPDDVDVDVFRLRPAPAWTSLPGRALPAGRFGQATVHDTKHDRMVIFGGVSADGYLADPWSAPMSDPSQWSPLVTQGTPPPPRHEPVGVYDPLRDRAMFFGGWTYPSNYFDDLWSLSLSDPPTWTQLKADGPGPPGRRAHTAVYDPARDRMLVYGGSDDSLVFGDLWALDLAAMRWTRLETTGTPPPERFFAGLIYDPSRDRLVLHGGRQSYQSMGDVWELRLADLHWSPIDLGGYPLALERHVASYDTERDRMLVYGGWDIDYDVIWGSSATYALVFRPTPHWEQVRADGPWPDARAAQSQVFDPLRDRLDVFGGTDFGNYSNDRWSLQFTTAPARHAWALSSSTAPGRARVVWQYVDAPGASVQLERMEEGGDWRTLASALPDADSRIVVDDTGLRSGWRYSYRLLIRSPLGDELAGTIAVDIPGATSVDLAGARPNPARASELAIWFSLPRPGDARLTLFDLRGRAVWDETMTGLAVGPQVVRPDTRLAAGVYFFRVEQAGQHALRKITILP